MPKDRRAPLLAVGALIAAGLAVAAYATRGSGVAAPTRPAARPAASTPSPAAVEAAAAKERLRQIADHARRAPGPIPGYGRPCQLGYKCGELDCITVQVVADYGICTKSCELGRDCDGAPPGTKVGCIYGKQRSMTDETAAAKYCAFLCKLDGNTFPCPKGLVCETVPFGQEGLHICIPPQPK